MIKNTHIIKGLTMKYSEIQKTLVPIMAIGALAIAGCNRSSDGNEPCDPRLDSTASSNTGSIQVTVKDFYSDEPIGDAQVTLNPGNYAGTTGADGTVTFTGITSYRNYQSEVTHKDCSAEDDYGLGRTAFIRVNTGQTTTVTVPLKKSAVIHGALTSSDAPLSDAFVVLSRMQSNGGSKPAFEQVALLLTDANGDYRFNGLPEGLYNIRALADSHHMTDDDPTLDAGQVLKQNIVLTVGTTALSYTISSDGVDYGEGRTVTVEASVSGHSYTHRYLAITDVPKGGEALPGEFSHQFTGTAPGDYTAVMMLADLNGVCKLSSPVIVTLTNHPTEAYPTVIPGPSELPLLDSCTLLAKTRGTYTFMPKEKVYFRGWGRDYNVSSP
jgi:hypothetical protein